jgi:hypothetical protein
MTTTNYPEMYGSTNDEIQATFSYVVNKYRVTSKNEIKVSRGIEFDSVVAEIGANSTPNKNKGWFKYYMTKTAFAKFEAANNLTINILLD